MTEQVSQRLSAQELVNPNLKPSLTLEVNVVERVSGFMRVKSKFGVIQLLCICKTKDHSLLANAWREKSGSQSCP
jgi:hypothetical protein